MFIPSHKMYCYDAFIGTAQDAAEPPAIRLLRAVMAIS